MIHIKWSPLTLLVIMTRHLLRTSKPIISPHSFITTVSDHTSHVHNSFIPDRASVWSLFGHSKAQVSTVHRQHRLTNQQPDSVEAWTFRSHQFRFPPVCGIPSFWYWLNGPTWKTKQNNSIEALRSVISWKGQSMPPSTRKLRVSLNPIHLAADKTCPQSHTEQTDKISVWLSNTKLELPIV